MPVSEVDTNREALDPLMPDSDDAHDALALSGRDKG